LESGELLLLLLLLLVRKETEEVLVPLECELLRKLLILALLDSLLEDGGLHHLSLGRRVVPVSILGRRRLVRVQGGRRGGNRHRHGLPPLLLGRLLLCRPRLGRLEFVHQLRQVRGVDVRTLDCAKQRRRARHRRRDRGLTRHRLVRAAPRRRDPESCHPLRGKAGGTRRRAHIALLYWT